MVPNLVFTWYRFGRQFLLIVPPSEGGAESLIGGGANCAKWEGFKVGAEKAAVLKSVGEKHVSISWLKDKNGRLEDFWGVPLQ